MAYCDAPIEPHKRYTRQDAPLDLEFEWESDTQRYIARGWVSRERIAPHVMKTNVGWIDVEFVRGGSTAYHWHYAGNYIDVAMRKSMDEGCYWDDLDEAKRTLQHAYECREVWPRQERERRRVSAEMDRIGLIPCSKSFYASMQKHLNEIKERERRRTHVKDMYGYLSYAGGEKKWGDLVREGKIGYDPETNAYTWHELPKPQRKESNMTTKNSLVWRLNEINQAPSWNAYIAGNRIPSVGFVKARWSNDDYEWRWYGAGDDVKIGTEKDPYTAMRRVQEAQDEHDNPKPVPLVWKTVTEGYDVVHVALRAGKLLTIRGKAGGNNWAGYAGDRAEFCTFSEQHAFAMMQQTVDHWQKVGA